MLPPGADVAMSHSLPPPRTIMEGSGGETSSIVRRQLAALSDDGSVEKMLEGDGWTGLYGSADDESRAEKHERRDDDVLEHAFSALAAPWNEAFSWPGGLLPLAGFRNRNCGCVATASRSLAHFYFLSTAE